MHHHHTRRASRSVVVAALIAVVLALGLDAEAHHKPGHRGSTSTTTTSSSTTTTTSAPSTSTTTTSSSTTTAPTSSTTTTTQPAPPPAEEYPIGVWLQDPVSTAVTYRNIGVSHLVGLWGPQGIVSGASQDQLNAAKAANMKVVSYPAGAALDSANWGENGGPIVAFMHRDEPDLPPCTTPAQLRAEYDRFKAINPRMPVYVNFGPGPAFPNRSCYGDVYGEYSQAADILSFDYYPWNEDDPDPIGSVNRGLDNLRRHGDPVWVFFEMSDVHVGSGRWPTYEQHRDLVLSTVDRAAGVEWFCHVFTLDGAYVTDRQCLDDRHWRDLMTRITADVRAGKAGTS